MGMGGEKVFGQCFQKGASLTFLYLSIFVSVVVVRMVITITIHILNADIIRKRWCWKSTKTIIPGSTIRWLSQITLVERDDTYSHHLLVILVITIKVNLICPSGPNTTEKHIVYSVTR